MTEEEKYQKDIVFYKELNERIAKNLQERKTLFVIVQGEEVVCRIETNLRLVHIDQLKGKEVFLTNKREVFKFIALSRSFSSGAAVPFVEFCEENDFDPCEICNSINTEWRGFSGDGGSYVGFQECSSLKCNECGHESSAE